MTLRLPTLVVTLGDPAGVGAEVTLKALADPVLRASAHWIILGDRTALLAAEHITGLTLAPEIDFRDQHVLGPIPPRPVQSPSC